MQRKAEKDNVGSLPYKFWNKQQKKAYTRQVQNVNKLIGEFGEKRVYDYLINKNKKVYSSLPKWVKEEISSHTLPPQREKEEKHFTEDIDVNKKPRKAFGKRTLFSKLRPLDEKEN